MRFFTRLAQAEDLDTLASHVGRKADMRRCCMLSAEWHVVDVRSVSRPYSRTRITWGGKRPLATARLEVTDSNEWLAVFKPKSSSRKAMLSSNPG